MGAVMQAGREMDAEVAEHVMGWGWMTHDQPTVLPQARWLVPPEEVGDWGHVHPADLSLPMEEPWWLAVGAEAKALSSGHVAVPCYSTDIAAAWEVVEKMWDRRGEADNWHFDLANVGRCFDLPKMERGYWAATFFDQFEECAPTPAGAICLAALKAVGVRCPSRAPEG